MAGGSSTKVVQITNIAPQATKDQLQALFGMLGKIEEIRLCKFFLDFSYEMMVIILFVIPSLYFCRGDTIMGDSA